MSSEGLNAGASSFTPGGAAPAAHPAEYEDSFAEYAEMMDDIENEAETEDVNNLATATGGAVVDAPATGVSGLPAHLAAHAAEFWFPECRDCQCCNGYKHGCSCAPTHGGVCKCSGGVFQAGAPSGPPMHARGGGPPGHAPGGSRGPPGGGGGRGKVLCKFFTSPGGCRFGDKCRFAHF